MGGQKKLGTSVRDSLFRAASRTYGEQYIEPLIRRKYGFHKPAGNDHDAADSEGIRYEIKASKVMKKRHNLEGSKPLLERILFEEEEALTTRMVPFADATNASYDANIQNVKRDHFDTLIYVLLFSDCVKVFFAPTEDVIKGKFKGWSDKHGLYDQHGKSGQFSIRKTTIDWHLKRYLKDTLDYNELSEIYKALSK